MASLRKNIEENIDHQTQIRKQSTEGMMLRMSSDFADGENILPELDGPSIYEPLFALERNVTVRYPSSKQA